MTPQIGKYHICMYNSINKCDINMNTNIYMNII